MIGSFRSKGLKKFAATGDGSKLSLPNTDRVARILMHLNAARSPREMDVAGYKFHGLKGRDKGRYAVWASGNYRITFGWQGEDAIDVDLEDYH